MSPHQWLIQDPFKLTIVVIVTAATCIAAVIVATCLPCQSDAFMDLLFVDVDLLESAILHNSDLFTCVVTGIVTGTSALLSIIEKDIPHNHRNSVHTLEATECLIRSQPPAAAVHSSVDSHKSFVIAAVILCQTAAEWNLISSRFTRA